MGSVEKPQLAGLSVDRKWQRAKKSVHGPRRSCAEPWGFTLLAFSPVTHSIQSPRRLEGRSWGLCLPARLQRAQPPPFLSFPSLSLKAKGKLEKRFHRIGLRLISLGFQERREQIPAPQLSRLLFLTTQNHIYRDTHQKKKNLTQADSIKARTEVSQAAVA